MMRRMDPHPEKLPQGVGHKSILVICETWDGRVTPPSLALLGQARAIARSVAALGKEPVISRSAAGMRRAKQASIQRLLPQGAFRCRAGHALRILQELPQRYYEQLRGQAAQIAPSFRRRRRPVRRTPFGL